MDRKLKIAHQCLSVLELAEAVGNVSEACRRRGMTRTRLYEDKRRFQAHDVGGLKNFPPSHKWHPRTTPPEIQEKVVALSLERLSWSCYCFSDALKPQGTNVSGPTIQNTLNKNGLPTMYDRLLRLEKKSAEKAITLTAEQVAG